MTLAGRLPFFFFFSTRPGAPRPRPRRQGAIRINMQKVHAARLSARKEGLAGRELISACLRAQRRLPSAMAHRSHGRRARGALAAAGCGRMQKGGGACSGLLC